MDIKVDIDSDAIQQQVVKAILDSAIGEQVKTAIEKALTETTGDWNNKKTLVQRAVDQALHSEIHALARSVLEGRRATIRDQMESKLTDEVLSKMAQAAWAVMEGRLNSVG